MQFVRCQASERPMEVAHVGGPSLVEWQASYSASVKERLRPDAKGDLLIHSAMLLFDEFGISLPD